MAMPGHALDWVPELPAELLQRITAGMGTADMASALSVNSAWQQALGRAVLELRPQGISSGWCPFVPVAARFPELQRLYLDDCIGALITDAQACEASKLRRLTHLSLHGCRAVTDAATEGLCSLTGLQELDLSGCEKLSVCTLTSLQCAERLACLDLRKCDWLRDEHMGSLCQLTGLRVLSLADCKNVSAGVSLLRMLPNLVSLNLSGLPDLSDSALCFLVRSTELEELVIDRCCQLRGFFLGELAQQLPRLRVLSMQDCPLLSNGALSLLTGAPALEQLMLDMCELITDEGVAHLAALSTLRTLSMRECSRVAGTGFAAFAAVAHPIYSINLSCCPAFSQPGSDAVAALPHLAELDLSSCERVGCGVLRALSRLKRLRALRLAGCTCVRDEGLRHLARGCTSLRSLDLSYCSSIRDEGVVALAGLPSLSSIMLVKCKHVGDVAAMALTAARQLQEVSLSFTAVTPAGVETLAAARRLKELPILGCHLLRPDTQAVQPGSADDWRGVVQWRERRSLGYC